MLRHSIYVFVLTLVTTLSCAPTTPQVRATWYLRVENSPSIVPIERRSLYIGLLNEGSEIIEEGEMHIGPSFKIPIQALQPGQIRFWRLSTYDIDTQQNVALNFDPEDWRCRLPVSVILEEAPSRGRGRIKAKMATILPTSIPIGWETTCKDSQNSNSR